MIYRDVSHALEELHDAGSFFCSLGHSVKLDGLDIYRPNFDLNSDKAIHYRMDRALFKEINIVPFTASQA